MIQLYGQITSGNCWKVRLLLNFLGQPFAYQSLDTIGGGTREDWFLKINPVGQIPCLVLADGETIAQSNAIIWRLAQGSPWWPQDLAAQTRVMSWLFWEQYSHEPALAVARSWKVYRGWDQEKPGEFSALIDKSHVALKMLEMQLTHSDWLASDQPTIADLALYPYTALCPQAGLDLSPYPNTQAWIARVEALDGYSAIRDQSSGS